MVGLSNFDESKYPMMKDRADFSEPIPAGDYPAIIVKSEMRDNKNKQGQHLLLEFVVIGDGEHKGRKVWDQLNLINPSKQAKDIACSTLKTICHAVNVLNPPDSEQLHSLPMTISVYVDSWTGNDDVVRKSNKIKMYRPFEAASEYKDGAVPESELPPVEPAIEHDDIPF